MGRGKSLRWENEERNGQGKCMYNKERLCAKCCAWTFQMLFHLIFIKILWSAYQWYNFTQGKLRIGQHNGPLWYVQKNVGQERNVLAYGLRYMLYVITLRKHAFSTPFVPLSLSMKISLWKDNLKNTNEEKQEHRWVQAVKREAWCFKWIIKFDTAAIHPRLHSDSVFCSKLQCKQQVQYFLLEGGWK